MDKATEMGKTSAVGSVHLFLGVSISSIILAIGTVILGIYILPGAYGLYAVALIPIATLSLLQDWGIGSALTRFCAKYRAANDTIGQRNVINAGLIFGAITGLVLTVISLSLSNFFAFTVYNKPASALLIAFSSMTIFPAALISGIGSIFTGFEKMKLNSYLSVLYAIMYGVLAPLLVYFGYGAEGAIIGYVTAIIFQAVVALLFLYFFILRKLPHPKTSRSEIFRTLKPLLRYGIPLGIGNLISNLGTPVFSFLMATYVDASVIGNYKIATNFVVIITFITVPINNVLFPAFSKITKNETNLVKTVFASSIKYANLFLIPATLALIVLAKPLIGTLYGNKWPSAPLFLALSLVFYLLSLFGNRSTSSILSAFAETKLLMKLSLLSLIIAIPMAFLLVPWLGVIGLIIGLPIAALPSTFIALYLIWTHYGAKADFGVSAKIFLASTLSTVAVYLFVNFFNVAYWILLVGGAILFLAVYIVSAPLMGAINQSDVNNLRTMFSGLGIISRILDIPLKIIRKLTRNKK